MYSNNNSNNTTTSIPFVHYYCDCPALKSHNQTQVKKNPMLLDDNSSNGNLSTSSSTFLLSPSNSTPFERVDENTAFTTGRHLLSPQASSYLYPLSRLYFCEDCHEIRCPNCVQDEIISYYCPNCLFEVPTASVKSEKNRCARNCFQCPICHNTLAVMASQDTTTPTTTGTNTGPYFLACNVCRWNSQEIGMMFEKPTSLALQLQKNEDNQPDVQEFDNLKEHFEKHLRVNTPSLPSSFLSFNNGGSFNKMFSSSNLLGGNSPYDFHHLESGPLLGRRQQQQQQLQGKLDDITSYEPSVRVEYTENKTLDTLRGLRDVDRVSNLDQRYTQLYDQPYLMDQIHPQRIHLCVKRAKRCHTCRHILIKPEQKAQATRFKIKLVAMNNIPNISIINIFSNPSTTTTSLSSSTLNLNSIQQQSISLKVGTVFQFALKFTNPLYEELSVTLATLQPPKHRSSPSSNINNTNTNTNTNANANTNTNNNKQSLPSPPLLSVNGRVTIVSPHFTVNAYNETIEYDDEIYPIGNSSKSKSGLSSTWANGIYEKRNNYTSVIVEVIPDKPGEFKFPLLVTCSYKSEEDRMDISSGDIDVEEIDGMDNSSIDGSRKSSILRMDDDRTKTYSFWCLIGLGNVQNASS